MIFYLNNGKTWLLNFCILIVEKVKEKLVNMASFHSLEE
jgi:hypothetical protein